MKTWRDAFKPPFSLSEGHYVLDANYQTVLNIVHDKEYALKILNVLNGGKENLSYSPFRSRDLFIFDSREEPVIIIRGWGYLTGIGGLNLPDSEALNIQDDLQNWILDKLNGNY